MELTIPDFKLPFLGFTLIQLLVSKSVEQLAIV